MADPLFREVSSDSSMIQSKHLLSTDCEKMKKKCFKPVFPLVHTECTFCITLSLPCRHTAVLVESIKKGIRDADSEARVEARK